MCLYCNRITCVAAILIGLDACRTARVMKCGPAQYVAEQLPNLVLSIILGFRVPTGCETMLPLFSKGTNTGWEVFIKYANFLTVALRDDNVDNMKAFVCSLYGIGEKDVRGIDDARHSLFVKAKRYLDVFPPTRGAIALHSTRANY